MAPLRAVPDTRFGKLSKSGHGYVVAVPAAIREALGWTHGAVLELWIEGDTLHVHRALRARDAREAAGLEREQSQADPGEER